jgi:hypothetical protein
MTELLEQVRGTLKTSDGKIYPRTIAGYADINNSPDGVSFDKLPNDVQKVANKLKGTIGGKDFKSSHFDEPNILVHLRMNTRVDAEGKKVLFLEEVQSDWGQKGKKEGFKSNERDSRVKELVNKRDDGTITEKERQELGNLISESYKAETPTAPFVTDTNAWTKLGLKVALKEAVKQGADKIAWTTGEQQNSRYDLSKHIDNLEVTKDAGGWKILGKKGGETVTTKFANTPAEIEAFIGKDMAEKITTADIPEGKTKTYSGVELQVGGKVKG